MEPFKVLPRWDDLTEPFWTGGERGELLIARCGDCGHYTHPPLPRCPACLSDAMAPTAVSGRGTVQTFTLNVREWNPTYTHPYVIAVVSLEEQADLRLVTNVVGCDPLDVYIGMPVRVAFEPQGNAWLPMFEPDEGEERLHAASVPEHREPPRVSRTEARRERLAIVSGIGQSEVGRRLGRPALALTVDACLAAIADAGLTRDDIDGLASYPGIIEGATDFSGPGLPEVQDALRLELSWHRSGRDGAAQFSAIIDAVAAVAMGFARHVLVYRTVTESSAQGSGGRSGIGLPSGGGSGKRIRMGGDLQWTLPFGAYSAANWAAWYAQRVMHEHGLTREQLAQIPLTARANAARNPAAVYRDPMTLDDYLDVRMISTPLCLYDCDVPVDGATAFVISHRDHAGNLPRPAVRFEAVGTALMGRPYWQHWDDFTSMAARDAGRHLWTRTELTPADVDVAELYDGFSILTLLWLEALAFCGPGEGGAFIEGGKRIALDGELPVNTHGGQLSAGRTHGFGFLHEAVTQLRGDAGERQVAGAEVAVAAAGGGPLAGALLLVRER